MLTKRDWCNPVSKMPHRMKKGLSGEGIGHERFENSGSVWAGIIGFLQRWTIKVSIVLE